MTHKLMIVEKTTFHNAGVLQTLILPWKGKGKKNKKKKFHSWNHSTIHTAHHLTFIQKRSPEGVPRGSIWGSRRVPDGVQKGSRWGPVGSPDRGCTFCTDPFEIIISGLNYWEEIWDCQTSWSLTHNLNPGAFSKKHVFWTFWRFSGWISAKLDQGDWPNGARDMHKNAQKVESKTQSKISYHYTWLLHRKNCPSRWRFLKSLIF